MIIGIDLGTTYSVVSCVDDDGKPEIIRTLQNDLTTPSVVYIDSAEVTVGEAAKNMSEAMPDSVVSLVKRSMGTDLTFKIDGNSYAPPTISAMILKKLKEDAERALGTEVTDAVITVPAYFGIPERAATSDAGKIAGLNVRAIIEEPVAAAIAYGIGTGGNSGEKTILVYDLGGGTFDVSLLRIESNGESIPRIRVISTEGDRQLGGADWDDAMIRYIADQFQQQHQIDFLSDRGFVNALRIKCEKAKQSLATSSSSVVVCSFEGKTVKIPFDSSLLCQLTQHLLDRTTERIDKLLRDISFSPNQIDQVLLVGGSTKLKMVREMLDNKFGEGKIIKNGVHPDLCVAQGAAIYGQNLSLAHTSELDSQSKMASLGLVKLVCPHGLGSLTTVKQDGTQRVITLICKDSALPIDGQDRFATLYDNQETVAIKIYENSSRQKSEWIDPDLSVYVATVKLDGLPKGRPSGQPIDVAFELDEQFLLTVTAVDVNSKRQVRATIQYRGMMENEQLQRAQDTVSDLSIQS